LPAARAAPARTLDGSRDKLFWFLCGWLGGPNHYIERFGHPRLRARHLPYAIGMAERDQWMACMVQAMHEQACRYRAGAAAGRIVLRHRRLDAQHRILTRQMTLETAVVGGFQRCHGDGCLAMLTAAGAITAASAVVSGSIALAGNVVYWFERQGRCNRAPVSGQPGAPAVAASAPQ
jgi:truncated hemoglobin YjbI